MPSNIQYVFINAEMLYNVFILLLKCFGSVIWIMIQESKINISIELFSLVAKQGDYAYPGGPQGQPPQLYEGR